MATSLLCGWRGSDLHVHSESLVWPLEIIEILLPPETTEAEAWDILENMTDYRHAGFWSLEIHVG
jgi:hypothetical protein